MFYTRRWIFCGYIVKNVDLLQKASKSMESGGFSTTGPFLIKKGSGTKSLKKSYAFFYIYA